MKFVGPLTLSIVIVAVAIIIGTTAGRSSWQDFPENSRFNDYLDGRDLYDSSCGRINDCHKVKDLKEYSREYMIGLAETESMCPGYDLFEPFVPPELEAKWNDMEDFEEANRQEEEYVMHAHRTIGVYLVESASPTEEAAKKHREWKSGFARGFKHVKFVGYEEGIKLVKEKNHPYIIELSLPLDI